MLAFVVVVQKSLKCIYITGFRALDGCSFMGFPFKKRVTLGLLKSVLNGHRKIEKGMKERMGNGILK